jgi:2-keto-4-pentenoate hydratase/2-oxohepta-3-ene-1,7-dioic acid hydratase in catechol pathway
MKIVNFSSPTGPRVGVLDADHVVDVLAAHLAQPVFAPELVPHLGHTTSVIAHWQALRPGFEQAVAQSRASGAGRAGLAQTQLLAPMVPSTILCSGSNYLSHNAEKANADTSGKEPEFFIKTGDCVVGPGAAIELDRVLTHKLDGEVELAVVIGKPGRHIPKESALEHVFGYTIVNVVFGGVGLVRRGAVGSLWYELGLVYFFFFL